MLCSQGHLGKKRQWQRRGRDMEGLRLVFKTYVVGKARKSQEGTWILGFGVLEDKIKDILLGLFPGPVPKNKKSG